ncbi:hypothetical protein [Methylovulum psychrotolerans]|jgi:hypothetical protein|uniref:Uncharacterized protein n=1 Tax=Methylovulum psychrotolerans TaxID=1704499 RepID=A0A1Z4BXH5_9GAMM|nr:hypothetical protein [Methylovulum psychrotolerans]ASF45996.1 hypothetical protein CEK71_07820 [Methylovulum psychrotolerans]POZ51621.1 hypothetical protein AADEFJLK_02489 [Methylovulum psychrotolerans]
MAGYKVLTITDKNETVTDSCRFLKEMVVVLDVGKNHLQPIVKIKLYKSSVRINTPYGFEVSHHAHIPTEAGPCMPSKVWSMSEGEAVSKAISKVKNHIKTAIGTGHQPSSNWLPSNLSSRH